MNKREALLEIVNERDEVIGMEERTKIHSEGFLHREIQVWFFTLNNQIIFQHRSKQKDIFPDKLDATVSGHVEPNSTYVETATKETLEETGLHVNSKKLIFLRKKREKTFDEISKSVNNTFRVRYVYIYNGDISALKVEKGKSEGFELWDIEELLNISEERKDKFIDFAEVLEIIKLMNG